METTVSDEKCPIEPGVCPDCDRPYTVPDGLDPFDSGRCLDCELAALTRQLVAANAVIERLRNANLSQTGWEGDEDIVLLNGKPAGATITKHHREFDRWWESVRDIILYGSEAAAEAARKLQQ